MTVLEVKNTETAKQRLEAEMEQLRARREKLSAFMQTVGPKFYQFKLLIRQRDIMGEYLEVLQERLDGWEEDGQ